MSVENGPLAEVSNSHPERKTEMLRSNQYDSGNLALSS